MPQPCARRSGLETQDITREKLVQATQTTQETKGGLSLLLSQSGYCKPQQATSHKSYPFHLAYIRSHQCVLPTQTERSARKTNNRLPFHYQALVISSSEHCAVIEPFLKQNIMPSKEALKPRTVALSILNLSFSKTGTASMRAALETLGYPTYHGQVQMERPQDHAPAYPA